MTKIQVHPDELVRLSGELKQIAGRLREAGARLGGAVSQLSWQVGQRLDLEAQAAGTRRQAELLADEAEGMARFLEQRAELFRAADGQGTEDLGRTLAAFSASEKFLRGKLGRIEALDRWSGWAVGGSVAAGTIAAVEAGIRGRHHEVFGSPSARLHPEPGDNFKLAGPSSDRLPTPAETRIIQRILGVDEAGYGPKTKAAVAAFQQKHGITVDDQVMIGKRTWAALMKEEAGVAGVPSVPLPSGSARSAEELAAKFAAANYPGMEQWAGPIWKACQEVGLEPEIMAAQILAESGGDPGADAGEVAGKGLMQIEFSAHFDKIPGETEAEKLAWIQEPENNLKFGAKILKDHVNTWVAKYGREEGLKRAFQYWNYGSGAAAWVEAHSKGPDDWQDWVDQYSKTHRYIGNGQFVEVEKDGDYGTPKHWEKVSDNYHKLLDTPSGQESTLGPVGSIPEDVVGDQIQGSPDITLENAALPVNAPVVNRPGHRDPSLYDRVIDQFQVESNRRYRMRDSNGDKQIDTFCNIFVWDVTRAMGAEIPHRVLSGDLPAQGADGSEINASEMARWLDQHGGAHGWREVTPEEAQSWANSGRPAVAAYDGGRGTGHLAMVRPGEYDEEAGPCIAQAGAQNLERTTARNGFGASLLSSTKYYVHQ
ncbi:MAG TPA: transglycosylase SLT domain-containing protein [Symbiobacteriaceae bacterium]|nr:transglycosylase SLT domain-containing protein [Symbiobacteriaceae bacterium]